MKPRVLDSLLILLTLVGGVLAWQAGREQRRLRDEYERLSLITGDLPIGGAPKVH